ncbi:MAG: 30S ribosomal protein S8 [Anaerolineae bacterium]
MSVSDPIADMLTRIRNAHMARHNEVKVPYSKMKEEVLKVLTAEGYIEGYSVVEDRPHNWLNVSLKYVGSRRNRRPAITGLKRISKPGRRIYAGYQEIPWVLSGMGICVVTTPKGIMTGQQARRKHLGGEILCYVW